MMPPQLRKGKRRNYNGPLFEELPSLDMRWLARHNMAPKDLGRRVYPNFNWLNPGFSGLVITARAVEIYFGNGRQQQIVPIHWQPIHGMGQGAIRPIFGRPRCRAKCFKLYDLHDELHCKRCAISRGAVYRSQLQSTKGRALLQSQRLRRFLGEYPNSRAVHRPLWMPHRTYNRLLHRLRQLEAQATQATRKAQS
jgi:hypothetical protein